MLARRLPKDGGHRVVLTSGNRPRLDTIVPQPALDLHRHPGASRFPPHQGRPTGFGGRVFWTKAFVLFPGNHRKPVSGLIAEQNEALNRAVRGEHPEASCPLAGRFRNQLKKELDHPGAWIERKVGVPDKVTRLIERFHGPVNRSSRPVFDGHTGKEALILCHMGVEGVLVRHPEKRKRGRVPAIHTLEPNRTINAWGGGQKRTRETFKSSISRDPVRTSVENRPNRTERSAIRCLRDSKTKSTEASAACP